MQGMPSQDAQLNGYNFDLKILNQTYLPSTYHHVLYLQLQMNYLEGSMINHDIFFLVLLELNQMLVMDEIRHTTLDNNLESHLPNLIVFQQNYHLHNSTFLGGRSSHLIEFRLVKDNFFQAPQDQYQCVLLLYQF